MISVRIGQRIAIEVVYSRVESPPRELIVNSADVLLATFL
jgi:hypothetical protein